MRSEVMNKNKNSVFNGPYIGGNLYINMYQDSEREFVVTHNSNIRPVSYFTGRETELQKLRQRIEEGRKSVLVSGMGGIGKTHICRKLFEEYLTKHANNGDGPFKHIGYVEYNGGMSSSLQNCLKYKKQDSPEQNQEAAWRELEYLAADGKLLLFVDNVNVSVGEDAGLERLKQIPGAVVLTSRRTSFSKEFEPYRIDFLSTEQCIEIYERIRYKDSGNKVSEEEISDLKYVIDILAARHTITVEFLACLAETKHWSVKRLRDELENKGFQLEYRDEEDKLVNIQKSYEALYDLSKLSEAEQNILEAFSIFPYIPLAVETCNEWLLADAGVLEEADILTGLYRKGWLQYDVKQESYALHPVFKQFIYEKCRPKAEKHQGLIEVCCNKLEMTEKKTVQECRQYIPFAENIARQLDWRVSSIEEKKFKYYLAYWLGYISEYKKADEWYKIAFNLNDEIDSIDIKILSGLALIYKIHGMRDEAEKMYNEILNICKKMFGEEYIDVVYAYNDLACLYREQGKYREAAELLEEGLRRWKKINEEDHPFIMVIYRNLGVVYGYQGKYEKAYKMLEESLNRGIQMLGENSLDVVASYSSLALLYFEQGMYMEAKKLLEKSLRVKEAVLGENNPDTAANYNNLAAIYVCIGEYEKAKILVDKSLRIMKRIFGEDSYHIAENLNILALIYERQKDYKNAFVFYAKAFKLCESKLGVDNVKTRIFYTRMIIAYSNCNFGHWLKENAKQLDESSEK